MLRQSPYSMVTVPPYRATACWSRPRVSLSIYPSIHLSFYLSIFLSIYLSAYRSIYLSIDLSIYLSIWPGRLGRTAWGPGSARVLRLAGESRPEPTQSRRPIHPPACLASARSGAYRRRAASMPRPASANRQMCSGWPAKLCTHLVFYWFANPRSRGHRVGTGGCE